MVCSSCKADKPREAFNKKRHSKSGVQSSCRSCQTAYDRAYYRLNPKARIALKKQRVIENKKQLFEYLIRQVCKDCGIADPDVLEFDHLRDKEASISRLIHEGYAWDRILAEIRKCEVRCANCHRKKTLKQFGYKNWKPDCHLPALP